MAYIFQQISDKGSAQGITPNTTQDARDWYRDAANQVASVNTNRMMNDKKNIVPSLTIKNIGQMFMFFYDPKMKDILPYYDIFPLIFLVDFQQDGFLGINLHYLPTYYRAQLMNGLYNITSDNKYDDNTKLKISYRLLKGSSQLSNFSPCLKRYLWSNVQGQFLNVQPLNWDTALMLPTERFKKATKAKVQNDSVKALR